MSAVKGIEILGRTSGEKYRSVKHQKDLSEVTCGSVPGLVLDLRNIFIKR